MEFLDFVTLFVLFRGSGFHRVKIQNHEIPRIITKN